MRFPVQFSLARVAAAVVFALCLFFSAERSAPAQAVNQYRLFSANGATIVPGTTPVTGFSCGATAGDDCVATIALPFAYNFYGNTYTSAVVSSNGSLQFATASPDYGQFEVCFPLNLFGYSIIPHFSDLTIRNTGEGIFTSVSGNAPNRIFNIEWRASPHGKPAGSLNFEIRLYETQEQRSFDIIYGTVPNNGFDATVGVQRGAVPSGDAAGSFTQYECRIGGLRDGQMIYGVGAAATSLILEGQAIDAEGNPLSGVTINLTGATNATTTTSANGHYLFQGLTANSAYTVSAAQSGSTFYPASRTFASYQGNQTVTFTRTFLPEAGQLLISEFRLRGPFPAGGESGARDEFVEIYNNTDSSFVVNTPDGSSGWVIVSSATFGPSVSHSIPSGTIIAPRGHYLVSNGSGYTLNSFASPDTFYFGDLPDNSGIALVRTSNEANYLAAGNRIDAVGFNTETDAFYREGAGLPAILTNDGQYSFVRKLTTGVPQDTNNNAADFLMVSTNAASYGAIQSVLGAPGPQSSGSHIQRNASVKSSFIDPQCGGFGAATSACARVRTSANANPTSAAFGTLLLRRKFGNTTGQKINRLRFRIVDLTTKGNAQVGQSDLRALTSGDIVVTNTNGQNVPIRGLTLAQTSAQPEGGGINSTLVPLSVSLSSPLAPGASINVEFRLGVMTNGSFRFFVNVEAITAAAAPSEEDAAAAAVTTKRTATGKQAARSTSQR
jgi:hypothetical protein